ncbi:universal stress protein [Herminiimonas aquatilis]|uniref:Universal stress protein n=1 Tax=Herminiimonas aquatilis TaxID=345342 RepID=A0ABW2J7Q2_9BURK
MKILFAVDGSKFTVKAAKFLIDYIGTCKEVPELHLLHVKAAIPVGLAKHRARALLGADVVDSYYKDEAMASLAVAEKVLRKKDIAFEAEYKIGDASGEIAQYAKKHKVDLIVMGSHGHSALGSILLGSVTSRVLATTDVPLLIVR